MLIGAGEQGQNIELAQLADGHLKPL